MILFPIITILLIQSSLAFLEDTYPDSIDSYPEDVLDNDKDNDNEVHTKINRHFLRFGRNNVKYDYNEDGNDDYEDFTRPTRSGRIEKNDHFIRFGRGKQQDFLRFGRDPQRRDKTAFLRFGRSIQNEEQSSKRNKREAFPEDLSKRSNAFLRFGRNSNFVRFGRDPTNFLPNQIPNTVSTLEIIRIQEQTIASLLGQLISHKNEESKACTRAA